MRFCLCSLVGILLSVSVVYAGEKIIWSESDLSIGLGSYTEVPENPYAEKQHEYRPVVEEASRFGALISLGSSDGCLFRASLKGVRFGCTQNLK